MDQETLQFFALVEQKLSQEDLELKMLLKPLQITLKDSSNDEERHRQWIQANSGQSMIRRNREETNIKMSKDDLAKGLRIVDKKGAFEENKFGLVDFKNIDLNDDLSIIKENHQDNLISFLKPQADRRGIPILMEHRHNLSICICMYNEPKAMLKNTLKGVEQNIRNIVKSGTSCDYISVVVIIDGIKEMNKDMVSYFEEVQRENDVYIEEEANIDFVDLQKQMKEMRSSNGVQSFDETQENINLNMVLFDEAELDDRKRRKFKNIYKKYMDMKDLQTKIEEMKKNIPIYENLPIGVKNIFLRIARQQYSMVRAIIGISNLRETYKNTNRKGEMRNRKIQTNQLSQQQLINFSVSTLSRYQSILMKALQQTSKQCEQFISNRENLAYLASFRKKIAIQPENIDDQNNNERNYLSQNRNQTFMNLFVCVKYKNGKKLSSHNWFFNGFCKELFPKYTILLDVGLRPHQDALYKMYNYLKKHKQVGGVCGYMGLKLERIDQSDEIKSNQVDFLTSFMHNFLDIQRAQQVQYHFAHLIDKPFEAKFNFIHVLPGAFSAYNMNTLTELNVRGQTLLKEYFKSIDEKLLTNKILESKIGPFDAMMRVFLPQGVYRFFNYVDPDSEEVMLEKENIYLAEDRILCMGIHKNGKKIHYLPDAYAEVDPMKNLHSLMGQRRRWINGSMFAFNKVKSELKNQESNSCEPCLNFQMLYLSFLNMLTYFCPAIFLFTVHLAMQAFRDDVLPLIFQGTVSNPNNSTFYDFFVYTVDFIYVLLLGSVIFYSLNLSHNDKRFRPYIYGISTILGLLQLGVFILFVVDLARSTQSSSQTFLQNSISNTAQLPGGNLIITVFRWLLISSLLLYALPILIYLIIYRTKNVLGDLILGIFSSIFYSPAYLIILNIFSLCRIDDITWGTKGLNNEAESKSSHLTRSWKSLKYIQVWKFIFWNMVVGVLIVSFGDSYTPRFFISFILLIILLFTMVVKIIIGLIYLIHYACTKRIEKPSEYHIVSSVVLDNLSVLRNDILQEVQKNFMKLKQNQEKERNGEMFEGDVLSEIFNPFTLSRINFMKKLTLNASKINSKVHNIEKKKQNKQPLKKVGASVLRPIMEMPEFSSNNKIKKNNELQMRKNDSSEYCYPNESISNRSSGEESFSMDSSPTKNDNDQRSLNSSFNTLEPSKQKKFKKNKN